MQKLHDELRKEVVKALSEDEYAFDTAYDKHYGEHEGTEKVIDIFGINKKTTFESLEDDDFDKQVRDMLIKGGYFNDEDIESLKFIGNDDSGYFEIKTKDGKTHNCDYVGLGRFDYHDENKFKESLKEEAMYGLFVEVKNSDTDEIIEEKRKLMVGTKEECEDKKRHLEEVSNGVGNHINTYTVEFLGNSSYDNPSNPDKKENLEVKEDLEETFYIVAFDYVSTDQGDNFFNKEGIPGNHDRLWHWVDKENATKYQTREEAEKDIELAKDLFAEQCEFVSGEKPMFFEVGNYEEDNAVRVEVLSEDELAGFGFNESLKEAKEEHECCICHKKFKGFGNNAEPVCDGICCDDCNWRVVIPARVKEYEAGPSDIDFDDEMFEDCENCREHTAIPDDDDVDFTW